MAEKTQQERREQFEKYNPYAARAFGDAETDAAPAYAMLAVAYELGRLRSDLHFNGNSGRSS